MLCYVVLYLGTDNDIDNDYDDDYDTDNNDNYNNTDYDDNAL